MARRLTLVVVLLLAVTTSLLAHDMFLKLESFFLEPDRPVIVPLLNGTFSSSENAIDRGRIEDIAMVGPSGRRAYDTTVVSARHDSTFLALETGDPGTYVLGLSTRPNIIAMTGEQFGRWARAGPPPFGPPSAMRPSSRHPTIPTPGPGGGRSASAAP